MSDPAALTPLDIRFGASTDLLRLPAVMRSTGLARSTIYRLMSRGERAEAFGKGLMHE
jgi:predicted DNA-binding transcriptional regulator AlpA